MSYDTQSRSTDTFPFGQKIAWHPNPEWIADSNLKRFMDRHGIGSFEELLRRSVADVAWFWDAVMEDLQIEFEKPYSKIMDTSRGVPFTTWCVDGEMNIVHNCLDKWQGTDVADRIALRWEGEDGTSKLFTYAELNAEVGRCANALRSLGLGKGDAVGLYMPMTPEIVIAFLAVIKIGGIILPLFSGYGPTAIATRLNDAGAKALFIADGSNRRGKAIQMKPTVDEALQNVPTVEHVIIHRYLGLDIPWTEGRDRWLHELVTPQSTVARTERTAAEDVLMIIYTSGTTGRPKGAVHTHCGFPIKGAQDMWHAMDLKPEDVMWWMTDMGWMMGPWLVFGTLCIGATMMLYDGAPDFPDVDRVWQLVESHNVTHLGLSPVLIRALKVHGPAPVEKHDLSCLRAAASTGSPWDPESWRWLFEHVLGSKKPILNYSGGTEISGGIVCGNFFTPLKPCAFSGPVPGMDADVVDENGAPVRGAVGELIIRKPWIGMLTGVGR